MTRPPAPLPNQQPYPWLVPDLFRWFGLLGLSLAGVVVAWWCASGTASFGRQLPWLDVGVVAVVIGGLGNMTWLLQGRRALAVRRRGLLSALTAAPEAMTATAAATDTERLAVPGTTRHHRAGCPAIAGKAVEAMPATDHERAGRRPCGLCGG
ncbi:MAG: hypothetical protein QOJ03_765 [Frankiaceae bacterium]|jgi:hypothetical protein|nr:hypothetical protein [Frankiaceae bacterium]